MKKGKSDFETTVKYSAEDSIVMDVATQIVRLYGRAKVTYGAISLEAHHIDLNYRTNMVHAEGTQDSTGRAIGTPVFKDGAETYQAGAMRYNFKSKKASIQGVVTSIGDANIRGDQIKKDPENNAYIAHAKYTTCNLAHPHYYINAEKIKMVHNRQVVTGPFNLVIADIPTPLGFPLGIFPIIKKKENGTSGIIFPTYGEEPRGRGFFLRQGGYYWAASPYVDFQFLGELYSKGGWGLQTIANYNKRYRYTGSINIRFNKRLVGDEGFENKAEDFWIDWSHRPVPRGLSTFSASVSAGTSKFNARNSFDANSYLSNQFRSSISYSTSFRNTPFRLTANLNHDQNVRTGIVNLILPSVNLSMNRLYPFRRELSIKKGWWETISVGFDLNGSSRFTNAAQSTGSFPFIVSNASTDSLIGFNLGNANELIKRAQIGATYTVPVSASLKVLKYFSLNPNLNLQGYLYPRRLNYTYVHPYSTSFNDPFVGAVKVDTVSHFSMPFTFTSGISLTTRVYGTYQINGKRLQAIRHTLIPNIGLSFSPDFSQEQFGNYQRVQTNSQGDYQYISRYQNFYFGSPGLGRTGAVGFGITNTVEAKVRAKDDSTGKKFEKVSLLNNLSISGSYNILADTNRLSPIAISANTRFLQRFDVNAGAALDPYAYVPSATSTSGRRTRFYTWETGKGIGQISNAYLNINTSFKPPGARKKEKETRNAIDNSDAISDAEKQILKQNLIEYVQFDIPWSLNVSYTLNYTKAGLATSTIVQSANFSGDFSLTPKWKFGFSTGYDFAHKGISYTSVNVFRDLHCWEMASTLR